VALRQYTDAIALAGRAGAEEARLMVIEKLDALRRDRFH
jgi:hypothetical protein